jgi:ferric-dicitrate binding protein FerR (iron transport regulator)
MEGPEEQVFDEPAGEPSGQDALAALIRAAGKRPAPSAEDYERVLAASRGAWLAKVRSRQRRRWLYAAAASIAVVTIAWFGTAQWSSPIPAASVAVLQGQVEILLEDRWQPLPEATQTLRAGTRLRTVADGRAAFVLARASSLRLDRATEVLFNSASRLELEAGTLYFDSGAGGTADSVEIATRFGTVRDIGTQFEVRTFSDGLRLRVREGIVDLEQSNALPSLRSSAGEQLSIALDGDVRRSSFAADDPQWQWASTLAEPLDLDGRTAFEVLNWVARESGKQLRFADATAELRARNAMLSGSGRDLTPLELLEVVVGTADGLDYELVPGAIVIRRR